VLHGASEAVVAAGLPGSRSAGHLAALIAAYFLTGMDVSCLGGLLHYNLIDFEHVYLNRHGFSPDCPSCGPAARQADASHGP